MRNEGDIAIKNQAKVMLMDLFVHGLEQVKGEKSVIDFLDRNKFNGNVDVVAIGKAATSMMKGADEVLGTSIKSALVITKQGYADSSLGYPCIESGHPIPNQSTLDAGFKLLEFIKNIQEDRRLLVLISGGASSLVEILPDNFNLDYLQKLNKWLVASGLTIDEMNRVRQSISLIKGGKALNNLEVEHMTQLLISDVRNDDIEIIGSGPFAAPSKLDKKAFSKTLPSWIHPLDNLETTIKPIKVYSHIVASNEMACQSIISYAKKKKLAVFYHGQSLYGDVYDLSESIAKYLFTAEQGVHIWGGEPTLSLPEITGRGGRNQSLALSLACHLDGLKDITVLVGATDGSDGPTEDAGATIDGDTLNRARHIGLASDYLMNADAGTYLAEAGDLISTGPTGTNVMDIIIALKEVN